LTLHIDSCKLIPQMVPPAGGLASKLKLLSLPWPLTFRPLKFSQVTCVVSFLHANFQLTMAFSSRSRLYIGSGTGQTDIRRPSTLNAPPYGWGGSITTRRHSEHISPTTAERSQIASWYVHAAWQLFRNLLVCRQYAYVKWFQRDWTGKKRNVRPYPSPGVRAS